LHSDTSWKRRLGFVVDGVGLLLLAAAVFVEWRGGVRWRVGAVTLTAASGLRAALAGILLLGARYLVAPRPSLAKGLIGALRRTSSRDLFRADRVAAALDRAAVLLAALAFAVDLLGGIVSRVGGAPLAPGAPFAAVALAVLLVRWAVVRRVPSFAARLRARWGASDMRFDIPPARTWLRACVWFAALSAVLLREQLFAYTQVPDLGDPLFSMWRLAWVAHQLPRDPARLFDANIFHPATGTLAYSDAMLLPALIGAPALWLGAPVGAVYTTLLLFSYVAAGVAMFVLAQAVTRQAGAAFVAGLIFAFDPFRFSHYSHLELQFTFCMPLAVLFVLRTLAAGRRADGLLAGAFVALQGLCSLYYGAYLAISLLALVIGWACFVDRPARRSLRSLGLGAAIAAGIGLLLTLPYWANRATVGERSADEIRAYSAVGRDYFTADRRNAVYHSTLWYPENGERELFPGAVPVALGVAALLAPASPVVLPVVMTVAVGIDASLGLHGTVYSGMYALLPPIRGFRAPARFRAIVGLGLALLCGVAVAGLMERIPSIWLARAALAATCVLVLVDLHPSLEVQPLWDHAPPIYERVPDRAAVLADLPLPWGQDPFWRDPVYMYFSTFHWHPLVNGSSGFAPSWYEALGAISRDFPSDETLDAYRRLGTDYFVLHEGYYTPATYKRVVADAGRQPRLQFIASVTWEEGECRLYRLVG
jgi:hypothetical protein